MSATDDALKRGLLTATGAFVRTVLADVATPPHQEHGDDVVATNEETHVYHDVSLVDTTHPDLEIVSKATATDRGDEPCTHCYETTHAGRSSAGRTYRGP